MVLIVVFILVVVFTIYTSLSIRFLRGKCRDCVYGEVLCYRKGLGWYYPVVKFNHNEWVYVRMSAYGLYERVYDVGESVKVWVYPLNTELFYLDYYIKRKQILLVVLFLIGIAVGITGILVFYGAVSL